jgi:hypothetical protein
MRNRKLNIIALLIFAPLTAIPAQAQTAEIQPMSGGSFTITQSVIAAGGNAQQNTLSAHGTIGQPISGSYLSGNQFQHYTGFLLPDWLGEADSSAVDEGHILNSQGTGIRNVLVRISFPNEETQAVRTDAGRYYRFAGLVNR